MPDRFPIKLAIRYQKYPYEELLECEVIDQFEVAEPSQVVIDDAGGRGIFGFELLEDGCIQLGYWDEFDEWQHLVTLKKHLYPRGWEPA